MDDFDDFSYLECFDQLTEKNDSKKLIQNENPKSVTVQRSSAQKDDLFAGDLTFKDGNSIGCMEGNYRSYSSVEDWLETFSSHNLFFDQSNNKNDHESSFESRSDFNETSGVSKSGKFNSNALERNTLKNETVSHSPKNLVKLEDNSFEDFEFNEWFDACENTNKLESLVYKVESQTPPFGQNPSPFGQNLSPSSLTPSPPVQNLFSYDQDFSLFDTNSYFNNTSSHTPSQHTSPQISLNSPSNLFDSPIQPASFKNVDSPPSTASDSGVSWQSLSIHRGGQQVKQECLLKQTEKKEFKTEALLADALDTESRELEIFILKNEQELYDNCLFNDITPYGNKTYQPAYCNSIKVYSLSEVLFLNPSPQEGILSLTNDEMVALKSEHQEISFQLPLKQQDIQCLKRVRRKIRNKLSAQESRRKRKEYTDNLELQVKKYKEENQSLLVKLRQMEQTNKELVERHFSSVKLVPPGKKGISVMVLMVFFAAFISSFDTIFHPPYTTPMEESFPQQNMLSMQMGPKEPNWDNTLEEANNILGPDLEYPIVYPYYYRALKSRLITDEEHDCH